MNTNLIFIMTYIQPTKKTVQMIKNKLSQSQQLLDQLFWQQTRIKAVYPTKTCTSRWWKGLEEHLGKTVPVLWKTVSSYWWGTQTVEALKDLVREVV